MSWIDKFITFYLHRIRAEQAQGQGQCAGRYLEAVSPMRCRAVQEITG